MMSPSLCTPHGGDSVTQLPTIVPMESTSVRRIVAGQAVTDLSSAVKELVDNALDAGATSINIRLWDSGTKILEVSDDGSGVPIESRPYIALKNATSKIRSFEDIYSGPTTLGFRGEALFCLANISERLLVCTRTASDELGQKLVFARDGYLDPESVCATPRKIGTTVAVVGLFDALPVRKADMLKRIKQQRAKLIKLMQSYAILCTGVKFRLMDMVGPESREKKILTTAVTNNTLEQTISAVLGSRFLSGLTRFSVDITSAVGGEATAHSLWLVQGLVSMAPNLSGRSDSTAREHQYFSINNRPVELPRLSRAIGDIWRALEGVNDKRPACALCLSLPNSAHDVNLSPDKREVFLRDEAAIIELVKQALTELWSCQSDGTFVANEVERLSQAQKSLETPKKVETTGSSPGNGTRRRARRRMAFVHDLSNATMQHEGGDRMESLQGTINRENGSNAQPTSLSTPEKIENTERLTRPEKNLHKQHQLNDRERMKWTQTQLHFNKLKNTDCRDQQKEIELLRKTQNSSDSQVASANALDQEDADSTKRRESQGESDNKSASSATAASADDEKPNSFKMFAFGSHYNAASGARPPALPKRKTPPFSSEKESKRGSTRSPLPRASSGADRRSQSVVVTPADERAVNESKDRPIELVNRHADSDDDDENVDMECGDSAAEESAQRPRKQQRRGSGARTENNAEIVWHSFQGTTQIIEAAKTARLAMKAQRKQVKELCNNASTKERKDVEGVSDNADDIIGASKSIFRDMEIIGQFNLGFILARCSNSHLWILDQHACDEKYNFERLCATTVIHEQRLIAPMPLELSPLEESCILDNKELFEKNGFRFSYDADKPPRERLALTALPHSGAPDGQKAVQFGKEDVKALCAMLGETANGSEESTPGGGAGHGTGADGSGIYGNNAVRRYAKSAVSQEDKAENIFLRLPKAIAMFANRACRGSIMIGTALSQKEMERIIKRLEHVENPWNCPHGRPTMRHVRNLAPTLLEDEKQAQAHVARPTLAIMSQYPD